MTLQEMSNYGIAPKETRDEDGTVVGYTMPSTGTATCSHPMAFVIEYRPNHYGCRLCGETC